MSTLQSHTPTSFRNWAHAKSLGECLAASEASVRGAPLDPDARMLLVELLCVLGQWERALRQLQAWAGMNREFEQTAHLMRGLIRAERQRTEVLAGARKFGSLPTTESSAETWMSELWQALLPTDDSRQAEDLATRDALRTAALALAPDTPGQCDALPAPFAWITDTDTRLGPVCEVVLMGSYRWLALDDLRSFHKQAPDSLLDLVWSPVRLELRDGTPLQCYMPMRYPVRYPVRENERDAILLARETVWTEEGKTGVVGHGQKMWTTDQGDIALLDLRECWFHGAPTDVEAGAGS